MPSRLIDWPHPAVKIFGELLLHALDDLSYANADHRFPQQRPTKTCPNGTLISFALKSPRLSLIRS